MSHPNKGHEEDSQTIDEDELVSQLKRIERLLESRCRIALQESWFAQYARLHRAVDDDALETFKIMVHEFVSPEIMEDLLRDKGIGGADSWLRELLLMQRTYDYLLFTRAMSTDEQSLFPDADFATRRWLRELCWSHHFRLVHVRQGGFYPSCTQIVNTALRSEAARAEVLAEQSREQALKMHGESRQNLLDLEEANRKQAAAMRECANIAEAALCFEEFIHDERTKPQKYSRIHQLAGERGLYPLDEANFKKLWIEHLEKMEDQKTTSGHVTHDATDDSGSNPVH